MGDNFVATGSSYKIMNYAKNADINTATQNVVYVWTNLYSEVTENDTNT